MRDGIKKIESVNLVFHIFFTLSALIVWRAFTRAVRFSFPLLV